jgi:hypothetical protein
MEKLIASSNTVDFNDIKFTNFNPRFGSIKVLNYENFISKVKAIKTDEAIKTILNDEGDFAKMLNLIKSIQLRGFSLDYSRDKLYAIKETDGKLFVVDGHRRLVALNILFNFKEYESK